jgi:hypothetical protein
MIRIEISDLDVNQAPFVRIFDLTGRQLLQQRIISKVEEVDISDICEGMYIVSLVYQGEARSIPLVIKR